MKRPNGDVLCDKCGHPITAEQEKQGDALHYDKTDYHASCYIAYRRETPQRPRVQLDEIRAAFLILAALWLLALAAPADAQNQPTDVRGCMATYLPQSGTYRFEPFLKVADKDSPAEDGTPEIWGFRPWNLEPPDREGQTHPVNIRDDTFVPLNTFKQVGPRKLKCPEGLWP